MGVLFQLIKSSVHECDNVSEFEHNISVTRPRRWNNRTFFTPFELGTCSTWHLGYREKLNTQWNAIQLLCACALRFRFEVMWLLAILITITWPGVAWAAAIVTILTATIGHVFSDVHILYVVEITSRRGVFDLVITCPGVYICHGGDNYIWFSHHRMDVSGVPAPPPPPIRLAVGLILSII